MKVGILFDLDGTLLDTLGDLTDATNYALRVHGYPERSIAEIRRFVGNGAANQIRLSVRIMSRFLPPTSPTTMPTARSKPLPTPASSKRWRN